MKKLSKALPPKAVMAMFVVAVLLLLSGTIGGTRAALTYYSQYYVSEFEMYDIGVTLLEQGEHDTEGFREVSCRNYDSKRKDNGYWDEETSPLLQNMLAEGESLKPGKKYKEELKVLNSGSIDQYVRVSIYKYWLDAEGNKIEPSESGGEPVIIEPSEETDKLQELGPEWIDLNLVNLGTDWLLDEESTTNERTVLYYSKCLTTEDRTTSLFADSLTIDSAITKKVSQRTEGNNIITTFDYDGVKFQIEVEVDAVQDHNAEDAIWSAWGRKVSVNNKTLSLQ